MQQCCLFSFFFFSISCRTILRTRRVVGRSGCNRNPSQGSDQSSRQPAADATETCVCGVLYFCSSKFWDWGVGEGSGCNPNPPQGSSCNTGGTFLPSCYYKLTSIVLHLLCIILEMCLLYITTTSTSVPCVRWEREPLSSETLTLTSVVTQGSQKLHLQLQQINISGGDGTPHPKRHIYLCKHLLAQVVFKK